MAWWNVLGDQLCMNCDPHYPKTAELTIYTHDRLADIDKALVDRRPFRDIAGRYKLAKSSLVRHHDDHLPAKLVRAKRAAEAVEADALLDQVLDLKDRALGILDTAKVPRTAENLAFAIGGLLLEV